LDPEDDPADDPVLEEVDELADGRTIRYLSWRDAP
jgi:hypothetical protein